MVGQPSWRALAGVAAAGLLVGGVVLVLQFARLGWEPTAPFVVGTSWGLDEELAARHLPVATTPGNGYDGQWFLGLAYDPLLGERLAASFDMPRYRAGRPLQAVAGWLLAGGQAEAIPVGLLAVGPLAVALGCAATGRLVAAWGRPPWWGLGFALVPGVAVGVAFATAEPLALALAVVGLSLALERRVAAAGLAFAGAALTKESYLVFAVAAAAWLALGAGGRRRARFAEAATVVAPGVLLLGLWWAYVAWRIPGGPVTARPPAPSGRRSSAGGTPWAWSSAATTCPTPRSASSGRSCWSGRWWRRSPRSCSAWAAPPSSAGPGSCSASTGWCYRGSSSAASCPACGPWPQRCSPPPWSSRPEDGIVWRGARHARQSRRRGLAAGGLAAHGPRKSRTTRLNSSGASMLQACPTPGRTTSLDPGMAAWRSSATASGARTSWSP